MTLEELKKVFTSGLKELAKLPGKKGLKITFAKTPATVRPDSPGVLAHRIPVIVVKPRISTDLTGSTIAHEWGHILTLALHPKDDPAADAAGKKDENLMTPSNGGRDKVVKDRTKGIDKLELTPWQKKKVKDDGVIDEIGEKVKRVDSALIKEQFGVAADDLADQIDSAQDHHDLGWVVLSSEQNADAINGILSLGGLFPDDGPVNSNYRLLFNTDANFLTGIDAKDSLGIDREGSLQVSRNEETGGLSVQGRIIDYADDSVNEFPVPPTLVLGNLLFGLDVDPIPWQHQLLFDIPKSALSLSSNVVPVGIIAEDNLTGTIQDTTGLQFDRGISTGDLDLILSQDQADPGDLIAFSASGLSPSWIFSITVVGNRVLSVFSDTLGLASGSFQIPSTTSGDSLISVEDSSGESVFDVIEVASAIRDAGSALGSLIRSAILVRVWEFNNAAKV